MEYYRHYECPECEADCYDLCWNLCEHKGKPVFELDENSQTQMTCDECGCEFGTGDVDVEVFEPGDSEQEAPSEPE